MVGKTVSHYKILEKLSEGGMGVVYKAEDTKLKRTVALKFLPLELTREEEARKRFVHEAQAASALQHNNICTIHEIGEADDGRMFICMDCYEGETLKDKIAQGPLRVEEAIDLVTQVAEGLAEAHSQEILHRDIKPANIMVTRKGVVKVVDFGLAKLPGRTRLTKTGSTVGTASYMSPDQARGEEVDGRSDIFSLGAVLYELMTGQVPFPGERETVVLYKILHEEPEPVSKYRQNVPEGAQRIIDRALKKDVGARYQSAFDLHNELKRLRRELAPSKLTGGAAQAGRPGSRIRRVGAVTLSAAVVVAVVGGIVLIRQWQQRAGSPARELAAPGGAAPKEELFRVAVAPFWGQSEEAVEEGRVMQALVERRLVEELGGEKDVRIVGKTDIAKAPRSHAEARTMGKSLEATMVLWGEVLVLRGEVDIQPYITAVRSLRGTRGISVVALETRFGEPDQMKLRKAKAAEIGDLALLVAGAYYRKRNPDRALFLLRKISPPTQESLRKQGNVFYFQRNWDVAQDYYEKAIELDSTYAFPYFDLGLVHHRQGREGEAIATFKKATYLDSTFASPYIMMGIISRNRGHYEAAIAACKKAIELDPENSIAYNNLGTVYTRQSKYEEAIAAYEKAMEISTTDMNPRYNLGFIYEAQGRYEEAVSVLKKAIELAPEEAVSYNNLGEIYRTQGRYEEAISEYKRSIEIDSTLSLPHYNSGHAYRAQRRYEEAITHYKKAMELEPASVHPYNNLGSIYQAQGLYEVAIAAYKKAIELDPTNASPQFNLGTVYEIQGRHEVAIAAYKKAIELDPTNVASHVTLGNAYQAQGHYEEAIGAYQKAIGLDPTDTWVHLWYFLLLRRTDAREQAQAHIVELSKTLAGDAWINPVVRFYAGELTEKEVLRAGTSEDAQQDRELKCEAYYYVGMAHLLGIVTRSKPIRADTVNAIERFEKCTATRVEGFLEYQWAKSELRRLSDR